jgi:Na+-translocating ferredoxin:NAD+ oxidoreductase RnfG subunit
MHLSKKFYLILLLLGLLSIVWADVKRIRERKEPQPSATDLKSAFPDGSKFVEIRNPFRHWLVYRGGDTPVGAVFITTDIPPDVKGYVGEIPVLVGIDRKGVITRIVILENRETPYYMRMIEKAGFVKKFFGKSVSERWDIDTVSGATISSKAIVKDVETASVVVAERIFNVRTGKEVKEKFDVLSLVAVGIVFVVGVASYLGRRNRYLKWGSYAGGIAVLGLYLGIPLSFSHIASLLALEVPMSNIRLITLLTFALVTTILWGPLFCGRICPFGALQELAWKASPFRLKVSGALLKKLSRLRWLILFALIVLVFPLGKTEVSAFEPYPYFFDELRRLIFGGEFPHSGALRLFVWLYALVVLLLSCGVKRFWCRIFCPTGSCLLLLSQHKKRNRLLSGIEIS